jgi:hypothetical protein
MNGSAENTAHGTPDSPERRDVEFTLAAAQRMLPLVQRVVEDIVLNQRGLAQLRPEQCELDRQKRTLDWPDRARRYYVREEVALSERRLQDAQAELAALGLILLDETLGRVGFPTAIQDRPAYFSWQHGEDGIHFWHYPGETTRRPIPAVWMKPANSAASPGQ